MNRKEAIRQTELLWKLESLGFNEGEFDQLRRISHTLHHWGEAECNGEVETYDDGRAYRVDQGGQYNNWTVTRYQIPNREAGAIKRLGKMMQDHPGWCFYHQTDPRGAALYLYRPDDVPVGSSVGSCCPSIGICVY